MVKGKDKYLTDAPLDPKDTSHADWKLEDTQFRLRMWNSMEPPISNSLIYFTSAKQMWDHAKAHIFLELIIYGALMIFIRPFSLSW